MSSSAADTFPVPDNEIERLAALRNYMVLDSLPEQSFDDLTAIAAYICGTPIALVSLLDEDRQWFKSSVGVDLSETPRSQAFCSHAILEPEKVMVVPNALEDKRFANNPLVTEDANIRFYAGTPLVNSDGYALGTLCVVDQKPRELTAEQRAALEALGRQVVALLELSKSTVLLREQIAENTQKTAELEATVQQLQQTQTSLISSEKMATLGHLVRGMAHEINNPVSFIAGNLRHLDAYTDDLLALIDLFQQQMNIEPHSELAEALETIDLEYLKQDLPNLFKSMGTGATRIQRIVESLRFFSRLDETGLKNININNNLEAVLTLCQVQLEEQNSPVKVVREFDQKLAAINCDSGKINQALLAIIQNAVDVLKNGIGKNNDVDSQPTIVVRTEMVEVEGDRLKISVADNGSGISPAVIEKIFEPFFSTKPIGQGTGLGLAICRQIVNQHHGQITVATQADLGTTFEVFLPIHSKHS
ncbi:MAG: ATP-binding protein [Limnothrix sp.]